MSVCDSLKFKLIQILLTPDRLDPDEDKESTSPHLMLTLDLVEAMQSCMGQNFAFVRVKSILCFLSREYDFEFIAGGMPDIDYESMGVGPDGDCRVCY